MMRGMELTRRFFRLTGFVEPQDDRGARFEQMEGVRAEEQMRGVWVQTRLLTARMFGLRFLATFLEYAVLILLARLVGVVVGFADALWDWGDPVLAAACAAMTIVLPGAVHARARALLKRGVCGSCLYRLKGLPVEDDGCVVCPECGAAWRSASIRHVDDDAI